MPVASRPQSELSDNLPRADAAPLPWTYGRYATGNKRKPHDGPIRIWDAKGNVVADLPASAKGYADARLITEMVNRNQVE